MKRRLGAVECATAVLCAVLAVMGMAVLWTEPHARLDEIGRRYKVEIEGEYRVNGADIAYPLTDLTHLPEQAGGRVEVRGRFTSAIEENLQVMMHIENVAVRIDVDGARVFDFGEAVGRQERFTLAPGAAWDGFVSRGIAPSDEITICMTGCYQGSWRYGALLDSMCAGSEYNILSVLYNRSLPALILSVTMLLLGLMLTAGGVVVLNRKRGELVGVLALSALIMSVGLWTLLNIDYACYIIPYPALNGFAHGLVNLCIPVFFALYERQFLSARSVRVADLCLLISLAALAAGLVLQWTKVRDLYQMSMWGYMTTVLSAAACALSLRRDARSDARPCRQRAFRALLTILAAGVAVVPVFFLCGHAAACVTFLGGVTVFSLMGLVDILFRLRENARRVSEASRLKNELLESRLALALGQIKPHFLFNTLNAISGLCLDDPARADEIICTFSDYLRANLNSLESKAPIRFEEELAHVQNYVKIELMRFGDRFRVEYDIRFDDFKLPALSVQQLVENAIRHGLRQMPEGGRVTVRAFVRERSAVVAVEDDGAGFDAHEKCCKPAHGLAIVRERIKYMSGGTLEVTSAPGRGTVATIEIPLYGK